MIKAHFEIPIVMCTWDRIDRLPLTLEQLALQTCSRFGLYIWNNRSEYAGEIDALTGSRGWPFPIDVTHSAENVGGFGRFVVCRRLLDFTDSTHVIFVDDDQELPPGMVAGFLAEAEERTLCSRWAYRFKPGGHYWTRTRCAAGEEAHYCGTGGMIADIRLFRDEAFFTDCPERFRTRVEDLWLSYYARQVLGWKLVASAVRLKTVVDGKDTYLRIRRLKRDFLDYLRGCGWEV